jgi:hypothetical protein
MKPLPLAHMTGEEPVAPPNPSGRGGASFAPEGSPAELARVLAEQREVLRGFEGTALAGIAESLACAAEVLVDVQERQEKMRLKNMVTEEDMAREMGYVKDDGSADRKQFAADMIRCGVERHKTSRTRAFYFRDEVESAVRRLGE